MGDINIGKKTNKPILKFKRKRECPECNSTKFMFDRGDYVLYCDNCKLVLASSYDYSNGNKIDLPFGFIR